ncbi:MAG: hypothetical protein QM733_09045 [Ilumatobacteraceae bacterium]
MTATNHREPRPRTRRRGARPCNATAARRCWRVDTATSTASTSSWATDRTAAPPTSPSCVARRAISTSIVGFAAPPSSTTTPNDVKLNRNTTDAAAQIAGRSSGRTTWRATCHVEAPSVRAAPVRSGGSTAHIPPTRRTTTATLKNTWAAITARAVDCQLPGRIATNAAPTTTVGSMNGTVTVASTARRPRKSKRASTYAGTSPTASVSTVLNTACHTVNHTTRPRPGAESVSAIVPGSTTRARRAISGHR